MAWPATDNFDSYTIGNDLNTLNGGSGWSAAWAKIGTEAATIQSGPGGGQGGNAVRITDGLAGETDYQRRIATTTAGTVRFLMRLSITNPVNSLQICFMENAGADTRMRIIFDNDGNLKIHNSSVRDTIQAYSADTWYTIDVDFDNGGQPNLYRARVNGGTYTSYKTVDGGTYTNIDTVRILAEQSNTAYTFWVDVIEPTPAAGPPAETRTIVMTRMS